MKLFSDEDGRGGGGGGGDMRKKKQGGRKGGRKPKGANTYAIRKATIEHAKIRHDVIGAHTQDSPAVVTFRINYT